MMSLETAKFMFVHLTLEPRSETHFRRNHSRKLLMIQNSCTSDIHGMSVLITNNVSCTQKPVQILASGDFDVCFE